MALVLADRVNETTTTTGTGTVTLAGAVSGYQSFTVIGNGNTTYYTIVHQTLSEWEVGIGTYTASGTTLSRDTILASSNSGSAVNFSAGTKFVFCDYPAGRAVYLDSSTNVTVPQITLSSGTANGVLYLNGSKVATSGGNFTYDGTSAQLGDVLSSADNSRLYVYANTPSSTSYAIKIGGNAFAYSQQAIRFYDTYNAAYAGFIGFTTNSLTFGQGTTEGMRLTSTGLGIGTSSPAFRLHVSGSSSQFALVSTTDTTSTTGVLFGDSASNTVGRIEYVHSDDGMRFYTSGTAKATLDSSGNLGLGVTPSAWSSSVASQVGYGAALSSRSAGNTASDITHGAYWNGTNWLYQHSSVGAGRYQMTGANAGSTHAWFVSAGGTAGNAISFSQAMTLNASSQLLVNQTASGGSAAKLQVGGANGSTNANAIFAVEKVSEGYGLYVGVEGTGTAFIQAGTANDSIYYSLSLQRNGGNVGIGTSSPGAKLDVSGGIRSTTWTSNNVGINANPLTGTSTSAQNLRFQTTGADFYIGTEGSTAGGFFPGSTAYAAALYNANATPIQFWTSGTLRATLDSSGNLGIGTASPATRLHVQLEAATETDIARFRVTNGANNHFLDIGADEPNKLVIFDSTGSAAGGYVFRAGGTERMRLTSAGNLGIGTSSPSYPLQVRRTGGACSLGLTMDNYGSIVELARSIFYYAIGDSTTDRTGHLFFTRDATATDNLRLVINSVGNVGIGTATPSTNLQIGGTAASGGASGGLGVFLSRGGTTNFFEAFDGTKSFIGGVDDTQTFAKVGTLSNHALAIVQGNGAAIYVDTSKNVGIGTSSPSAFGLLAVAKDQTADTAIAVSNAGTPGSTTTMSFVLSESGAKNGWFRRYRDGSGNTEIGFSDALLFTGNVTGTKVERARIDSSGNMSLGTTSSSGRFDVRDTSSSSRTLVFAYNAGSGDAAIRIGNAQNGAMTELGKQGVTAYGATAAGDAFAYTTQSWSMMADAAGGVIKFSTGGNTERARIDSSGNFLINISAAASPGLTVATSKNISFSEGAGAGQSIATIFRQSNSADLILGSAVAYSSTANGFASSFSGAWARSAIGVGYGAVRFLTAPEATVAVGTDVTLTERARIVATGYRFGLGTTDPVSNGGSDATVMHLHNPAVGQWSIDHYTTGSTGANSADGTIAGVIGSDYYIFNYESSNLIFATSATERMRVTSAGNLLVGGTSNVGKLGVWGDIAKITVSGFDGAFDNLIKYGVAADLSSGTAQANRWIGIDASITAGAAVSNVLRIRAYPGGSGNAAPVNIADFRGDQSTVLSGDLLVGTTSAISTYGLIHVRGDNKGVVIQDSTDNSYRAIYNQSGTLYFWNGSNEGYLSSAGAWIDASDARLKENIVPIKHGLDSVMKSQPRSYKMKDGDAEYVGFIAQEMLEVIPECVSGNPDKQYGIAYGSLVAVAFKAIQEQQAMIAAIKAELDQLKGVH